jgi:Kef-type K+ transport system membrane component KefB
LAAVNNVEILILLVLLFMVVPDVCRRLERPALVYPAFVLFGLGLAPIVNGEIKTTLHQAGVVGFLLLLFQVGLEIDLPRPRDLLPALGFALPWVAAQYPLVLLLGGVMGLGWVESALATAVLTGVSVGMVYPAWRHYPRLAPGPRLKLLHILIVLETLTILLLAVQTPALKTGWSWFMLWRLAGVVLAVLLVAWIAPQVARLFQAILQRTTHWRTHLLVLLVLLVCAVGERLGLSAVKTAFFLGLFMSRIEHEGRGLEEEMAPISQRFLIPIFFVSLGLYVNWSVIVSRIGLMAFGSAGLLMGVREIIHRRWLSVGGDSHTYLLLCPNLTVVALGAATLRESALAPLGVSWLLLTGLFLTVWAIVFLPVGVRTGVEAPGRSLQHQSTSEAMDRLNRVQGMSRGVEKRSV